MREYYYMEKKPEQKQKGITKLNQWKLNFLETILNKIKKYRIKNTATRSEFGVDEIKKISKRADLDSLHMWCGWQKRVYLTKC